MVCPLQIYALRVNERVERLSLNVCLGDSYRSALAHNTGMPTVLSSGGVTFRSSVYPSGYNCRRANIFSLFEQA